MATEKRKLDEADLAQFSGSEQFFRHWLRKYVYTEGVAYVAEHAGAFWLVDEVAIAQSLPKVRAEEFQVWILKVDLEKRSAVLRCEDGNDHLVFSKVIEYTDFPLPEIRFYFTDNTILLPSEY